MDKQSPVDGLTQAAHENDEGEVAVVVDLSDEHVVVDLAAEHGVGAVRLPGHGFVDPVTITFLLFGSTTAVATVAYLVEQARGGQVFDLRDNAPRQAYRSKDVAHGLVQIIARDGTVSVEVKEPRGMFGLVVDALRLALVDLARPTTDAVKTAVADVTPANEVIVR